MNVFCYIDMLTLMYILPNNTHECLRFRFIWNNLITQIFNYVLINNFIDNDFLNLLNNVVTHWIYHICTKLQLSLIILKKEPQIEFIEPWKYWYSKEMYLNRWDGRQENEVAEAIPIWHFYLLKFSSWGRKLIFFLGVGVRQDLLKPKFGVEDLILGNVTNHIHFDIHMSRILFALKVLLTISIIMNLVICYMVSMYVKVVY
jgi:hypothetical protein